MKETYFMIPRDYNHYTRLIAAAWENGKPRQLEIIINIIRSNFILNGVSKNIAP